VTAPRIDPHAGLEPGDADAPAAARELSRPPRILALWTGALAAPAAWLLDLQVAYALVPWVCGHPGRGLALHASTLAALAVVGAGLLLIRRDADAAGGLPPGEEGGVLPRSRLLVNAGLALSALFGLLILVSWVPRLVLDPCR
jgi:hypothetical protein